MVAKTVRLRFQEQNFKRMEVIIIAIIIVLAFSIAFVYEVMKDRRSTNSKIIAHYTKKHPELNKLNRRQTITAIQLIIVLENRGNAIPISQIIELARKNRGVPKFTNPPPPPKRPITKSKLNIDA